MSIVLQKINNCSASQPQVELLVRHAVAGTGFRGFRH
jgi:hypothetical protein